jgi:hypothetical protein
VTVSSPSRTSILTRTALNRVGIGTMSAGCGDGYWAAFPRRSYIAPLPLLPLLRLSQRATRRWTRSFAAESPSDHPREPKDEDGGEPDGHHHEPRQCTR